MEDEPLAADKIAYIAEWLREVEQELEDGHISYGELLQINQVYDIVKEVESENDQSDVAEA